MFKTGILQRILYMVGTDISPQHFPYGFWPHIEVRMTTKQIQAQLQGDHKFIDFTSHLLDQ